MFQQTQHFLQLDHYSQENQVYRQKLQLSLYVILLALSIQTH